MGGGRTDSDRHELDTIEVLDFAARPRWMPMSVHGHVYVASERTLGRCQVGRGHIKDILASSMLPSLAPTALSMAWRVRT